MKKYNIEYKLSDSKTGYDSLVEMANCAGGICANSSLSWLGGYFQKEMRGIICMPSEWIRFYWRYSYHCPLFDAQIFSRFSIEIS
jgi:hypothetical protein